MKTEESFSCKVCEFFFSHEASIVRHNLALLKEHCHEMLNMFATNLKII